MGYVFYYFRKNWESCKYSLYLNTESCTYSNDREKVHVFSYSETRQRERWSLRLKKCLKKMPEELILIILDDFFLTSKVDNVEFEKCVERMKNNKNIACFYFDPTPGENYSCEYERFERKGKKSPYRFNLQIGLWRKEYLLHYLRNHEDPWHFESWGSIRSRRYPQLFYSLKINAKKVFTYPAGGVICDNKWNLMMGEDSIDFVKREFDIDYDRRGYYRKGEFRNWNINNRTKIEKMLDVVKSLI